MFRAPVGAEHVDPELGRPLGDGDRDRRATQSGEGHHGQVGGGEVGMVQQAGEEVGGATADAQALLVHEPEHLAGIPHVHQVHGPLA